MFKRILSLSLALIISAACFVPTFATDLDVPADESSNSKYQHIDSIKTSLSISGGTAHIGVTVIGIINHTTKITVAVTLQKRSGGQWTNVKTWNQTSNSYMLRLNKTKAVSKGTYRVKNVVKAYRNTNYETITVYSGTEVY